MYLIAGAAGANEYNIETDGPPPVTFGSLVAGDAYIVAGTGTAGLIAEPGNNQFGQLDHGCGHGEPDRRRRRWPSTPTETS